MNSRERRGKTRLPMRGFLACSSSFTLHEERYINLEIISLSASGMFLVQNPAESFGVSENDMISDVSISMAPFTEDRFCAVVRRIIEPDEGSIMRCGFGVEFVDLPIELEEKIDSFIDVQIKFFGLE